MEKISQGRHMIPIEDLLDLTTNEYLSCGRSYLCKIKQVSYIGKHRNQKALKRLSQILMNNLGPYKTVLQEMSNTNLNFSSPEIERVKSIVSEFLLKLDKRKLLFDRPFLKFFMEQGYLEAAQEFIVRVRLDNPQLTNEEIFQALRNVWIINSLQLYWGLPLEITPSVYAYSLLYPYTDNLLDNPDIKSDEKIKFNRRLSGVLKGEKLTPNSCIEEKVFSLVGQIESQYSRDIFPEIYDSLRLIHEAQIESVKQDKDEQLSCDQILRISFFKGGTSVLADAFLVKGTLDIKEMQFAFVYGSFLQLLDDLQDAEVDKNDSHQTLFSSRNDNELIDDEVISLISFMFSANAAVESDTRIMSLMKEVISACSLVMVMDAVGRNPKLISHRLYKELESYSKVSLSFYKEFDKFKALINEKSEFAGIEPV
ncbi:MAG: hypothetical protein SCM11_05535 [Bacillota bacterium]|nr:hypothetical protein [Bacillota bacterium]